MRDDGLRPAFRKALRKGSGRAMLVLRQAPGDEGLRDELLHACLNDLRSDRQCEEARDGYLFTLIRESEQGAFVRDELKRCLLSETKAERGVDEGQIFAILCRLAADAPQFDRAFLRDFLEDAADDEVGSVILCAWVGLEGLAGLLFCVERFSDMIGENIEQETGWLLRSLLDALAAKDGEEPAKAQLLEARARSDGLDRLLQRLEGQTETEPAVRPDGPMDYAAAKATMDSRGLFPRDWVKSATEAELVEAAADLLAERDERRLFQYLHIFRLRDFPAPLDLLFPLLGHPSGRVASSAARALGHLRNEAVRSRAFALIDERREMETALSLLENNFHTGDWETIDAALAEGAYDEGVWHGLQLDTMRLIGKNGSNGACRPVLLRLYEEGPCSLCRGGIVLKLRDAGGLPETIARECGYDVEPDVVECALLSAR